LADLLSGTGSRCSPDKRPLGQPSRNAVSPATETSRCSTPSATTLGQNGFPQVHPGIMLAIRE
jgi:hypothetical protein